MRKTESYPGELYDVLPNTGIPDLRPPASSGPHIRILLTSMFSSLRQTKSGRSYAARADIKLLRQMFFIGFSA